MASLKQNQYKEIANSLNAQRHELLRQINEHVHDMEGERGLDLGPRLDDKGDVSVAELILDLNLESLDYETEQLQAVKDAELRLKYGVYGLCIDCDCEITLSRLEVQPTASRCLECQELYESTHTTRSFAHY